MVVVVIFFLSCCYILIFAAFVFMFAVFVCCYVRCWSGRVVMVVDTFVVIPVTNVCS